MAKKLKMVQHLEERILNAVPSKIPHMSVSMDSKEFPSISADSDVEVLFEARLFSHKLGPRSAMKEMRERASRELIHHLYGDVYDEVFEILMLAHDEQYKTPVTDKLEALLSKLRP